MPEAKSDSQFTPVDETKKLYADLVAEIRKRQLSSSENFDKSVLTYSSAGLAFSLGFLKDFIPIESANFPVALYSSWWFFGLATCSTIVSFLASDKALNFQENAAYRYYIEREDSAFDEINKSNRWTIRLNYLSGGLFVFALILTIFFVSANLEKGSRMKQASVIELREGVSVPSIQKLQQTPLEKGAPAPNLPKIPAQAPTQQPSNAPAVPTPSTEKK